MNLTWPSFWAHIREEDRPALRQILAELLATGVLLGDAGRDRELYLLASEYQRELAEYLSPLSLELIPDPDRPIFQARPVPGECGLTARFTKDESLLVLALWRIYDEARMEKPAETVVVNANDVHARLKLYFEHISPPTESHLDRMLSKLRAKQMIRFQRHEDAQRFGESAIEILPTLQRIIPFESPAEWEQQAALHRQPSEAAESAREMPGDPP